MLLLFLYFLENEIINKNCIGSDEVCRLHQIRLLRVNLQKKLGTTVADDWELKDAATPTVFTFQKEEMVKTDVAAWIGER